MVRYSRNKSLFFSFDVIEGDRRAPRISFPLLKIDEDLDRFTGLACELEISGLCMTDFGRGWKKKLVKCNLDTEGWILSLLLKDNESSF